MCATRYAQNWLVLLQRFILRLPDYEFKVNIPQFPSFKPVIDVPDVITQWMAGFMANSPLPKIQVLIFVKVLIMPIILAIKW